MFGVEVECVGNEAYDFVVFPAVDMGDDEVSVDHALTACIALADGFGLRLVEQHAQRVHLRIVGGLGHIETVEVGAGFQFRLPFRSGDDLAQGVFLLSG